MGVQRVCVLLIGAMLVVAVAPIVGATTLNITLDTTPLTLPPGSSTAPFSVFFQLTDGSGTNDGNNTVTLTNFAFGGGSATPGTTLFGGAVGDLGSSVVLTDNSFLNSFTQGFTPGS